MKSVIVQLERLRRHYEVAVHTYDQIALLDLSHSLRIWTELGQPLVKLSPSFSRAMVFKTARPARRLLKLARGHAYVFSALPGGVVTYAANGHLAEFPKQEGEEKFTLSVEVKPNGQQLELRNFCFIQGHGERLAQARSDEVVKRCNFREWLGAEAVRLSYLDAARRLVAVGISREMIVKRVANTLDGSHPSAAGEEQANQFDAPVHHLLQFQIGRLPLPYFILLKIAQDILDVVPKYLQSTSRA